MAIFASNGKSKYLASAEHLFRLLRTQSIIFLKLTDTSSSLSGGTYHRCFLVTLKFKWTNKEPTVATEEMHTFSKGIPSIGSQIQCDVTCGPGIATFETIEVVDMRAWSECEQLNHATMSLQAYNTHCSMSSTSPMKPHFSFQLLSTLRTIRFRAMYDKCTNNKYSPLSTVILKECWTLNSE